MFLLEDILFKYLKMNNVIFIYINGKEIMTVIRSLYRSDIRLCVIVITLASKTYYFLLDYTRLR